MLGSLGPLEEALAEDAYHRAWRRDEERLERGRCLLLDGFDATAPPVRPLMEAKLDGQLSCLDDVRAGYAADQQRRRGFAEVPTNAFDVDPDTGTAMPLRAICALGDGECVACASSTGSLWVHSWREGTVVSRPGESGPGCGEDPVGALCSASPDGAALAAGDDRGQLTLWGLASVELLCQARIHHLAVTSVAAESQRPMLWTTSLDSYITAFDPQSEQVVERATPRQVECGGGVPNSVVALAGEAQGKVLLVGGTDGKLRVWTRDAGELRRQFSLECNQKRQYEAAGRSKLSGCRVASDGWRLAVSTAYSAGIAGRPPGRGGVLLFDLRRLGGGGGHGAAEPALVAAVQAEGRDGVVCGAGPGAGVPGMVLLEGGGEATALCIMDGVFRAFSLDEPAGGGATGPMQLVDRFEPGSLAQPAMEQLGSPFALEAAGGTIFTASDAPSVDAWRWVGCPARRGHDQLPPAEPPRVVLQSRCTPCCQPDGTPKAPLPLGASARLAQEALERDRQRVLPLQLR